MRKYLSLYALALVLFSILVYYFHTEILETLANSSPLSLYKVYLFNFIFSLFLCIGAVMLSYNKKYSDQIGFLYLASVVLKMIFFFLVFYKPIFKAEAFTNAQTYNLLIPIVLFIIFEVILIGKSLKNITTLKNDD